MKALRAILPSWLTGYAYLYLAFLYVPVLLLPVFSLNTSPAPKLPLEGVTLK